MTRHTLSNGLTLLVRENHTNPTAVLRGHVKAGAVCDTADTAGLAALTATLIRRGTTRRTFQQINEAIERVGANMDTSIDRHLAGFSGWSLVEDLPLQIEIAADILQRPSFPNAELEKVRGQFITSLYQLEDSTRGKAGLEFRPLCYPAGHPYALNIDGSLETIQRLQRNDLVVFYERFYSPRNTVIAVVGDVKSSEVIARLEDAFGDWQAPGDDTPYDIPKSPRPVGVRRVVLPMFNKTQVDLIWGLPALARKSPDYYAARVANAILGQVGLMGRLGANVRDKQGLAYYVSSGLEASLGEGPWFVYAGVAPDDVARASESILAEIARLRAELVTEDELSDAQDYLTGVLPLLLETNDGVASMLLELELYDLGLDFLQQYPATVRAVTRKDVQAAAQKYLDTENYALAIAGPYQEMVTA